MLYHFYIQRQPLSQHFAQCRRNNGVGQEAIASCIAVRAEAACQVETRLDRGVSANGDHSIVGVEDVNVVGRHDFVSPVVQRLDASIARRGAQVGGRASIHELGSPALCVCDELSRYLSHLLDVIRRVHVLPGVCKREGGGGGDGRLQRD